MNLNVKILDGMGFLPKRATPQSAGLDLVCPDKYTIKRGKILKVSLHIAIEIPPGYVGRIHGRSSLEILGLHVVGGVIDADYRGNVSICFKNHGLVDVDLDRNSRIGQLLIQPILLLEPNLVDELGETQRGEGGFGSTNVL